MEEAKVCKGHGHLVLITSRNDFLVSHRPTWLRHVLNTQLGGMVDRITEGEECIRRDCHIVQGTQEMSLLILEQWCWNFIKVAFPLPALNFSEVTFNEAHPCIDPFLALDTLFEGQGSDFGMETKVVG